MRAFCPFRDHGFERQKRPNTTPSWCVMGNVGPGDGDGSNGEASLSRGEGLTTVEANWHRLFSANNAGVGSSVRSPRAQDGPNHWRLINLSYYFTRCVPNNVARPIN